MEVGKAEKIIQGFWDTDVRVWDKRWVPIFRMFAQDLVSDAHISTGQVVLDIGTGTGVAAVEAARRVKPGGIILGIDRSAQMVSQAEAKRGKLRNICYIRMNAERTIFPGELFDAVISNCGVSYAVYHETLAEAFRVLRRGGLFAFNEWHLVDVPVHKSFSEILRHHRTERPSKKLAAMRAAIATMEHVGNRYADPKVQVAELKRAGFADVRFKRRHYQIRLPRIRDYLALRFEREALKRELDELPKVQREAFVKELKTELQRFVRRGRLVIDWRVTFTRARRPI